MQARTALAFFLTLSSSLAWGEPSPTEVPSPVDRLFIPSGFDDNDNVEIIMHGDFANSCHLVGRTGADVNEETKHITVWASAYVYDGGSSCVQTRTPFIQSARVGVLKPGRYTVSYRYNDAIKNSLDVAAHTTSSPEDYLYASVENAAVHTDPATGSQTLSLQGHYPYMFVGCMKLKEVRTSLNADNVLVVQPISEILNDEACRDIPSDHSFSFTAKLTQPFTSEGLLHVRVLNGDSLNRLVQKP